MYAVFKSGGKQYRVSKGEKLKLEKLEANVGKKVVFDQVLSVGEGKDINIGTPYLADAIVEAKVIDEGKDKKIEVVKFKRRKNYKRNFGHRQHYSLIEVTNITVKKKKAAPKKAAPKKAAPKKAAPKKATKTTEKQ
ncbi:MAG: 50S ribosomal protein L21 [Gammaproteobacteria bacterium]|nr:50S ribosomal protein L21 [Gammaproteobacteria bacterium]